jgi:hypothetical protein
MPYAFMLHDIVSCTDVEFDFVTNTSMQERAKFDINSGWGYVQSYKIFLVVVILFGHKEYS